jgi:pimeloyl-ACP methyl ester carboxylesterase
MGAAVRDHRNAVRDRSESLSAINRNTCPQSPESAAIMEWAEPRGERYADLKRIKQPTLVVNGNDDIMVPTINSFMLSQHIPNAQLILYPDSGHGALFQYPELFVEHTKLFLDA